MMNIKKTTIYMLIFAIFFSITVTSSWADDKENSDENLIINESSATSSESTTESDSVSAIPSDSTELSGKRSGDGTKLSWKPVYKATGYRIYRSENGKDGWNRIKTTGRDTLTYKDSKAPSGRIVYYKVRAYYSRKKVITLSASSNVIKAEAIYRVMIETGHGIRADGSWDMGTHWKGWQEAKLMIPICQSMTQYLRASGVYVYTDAFSGNNINLRKTIEKAKTKKLSVLVNVHCDSYTEPAETLPLYRTASQKKLAKALNKGVHSTIDIKDRGLKRRPDLYTLRVNCGTVAYLFETGSIKYDNKLLRKQFDLYGKGLAKGLCNYLSVPFD